MTTQLDKRIAALEARLPQQVQDPSEAQLAAAKTEEAIRRWYLAQQYSDKNKWTQMTPYTAGDAYAEAQKWAGATRMIKELQGPLAKLTDPNIESIKQRGIFMKDLLAKLASYATARGNLSGKEMTALVNATKNYQASIDEWIGHHTKLESEGFGEFDPREVKFAQQSYEDKRMKQFNLLEDKALEQPDKARRDMLDNLNASEIRKFADHIEKRKPDVFLTFFGSAGESGDAVEDTIASETLGPGVVVTLSEKYRQIMEGRSPRDEMMQRTIAQKLDDFKEGMEEPERLRNLITYLGMGGDLQGEYLGAGGLMDKIEALGGAVGTLDYDMMRVFNALQRGGEEAWDDILSRMFGNASVDDHQRETMDTVLLQTQSILDSLQQRPLDTVTPSHIDLDQQLYATGGWQDWLSENDYTHAQGKMIWAEKIGQEIKDQSKLYKLRAKQERRATRTGTSTLGQELIEAQQRVLDAPPSAQAVDRESQEGVNLPKDETLTGLDD